MNRKELEQELRELRHETDYLEGEYFDLEDRLSELKTVLDSAYAEEERLSALIDEGYGELEDDSDG